MSFIAFKDIDFLILTLQFGFLHWTCSFYYGCFSFLSDYHTFYGVWYICFLWFSIFHSSISICMRHSKCIYQVSKFMWNQLLHVIRLNLYFDTSTVWSRNYMASLEQRRVSTYCKLKTEWQAWGPFLHDPNNFVIGYWYSAKNDNYICKVFLLTR